MKVVLFPAASAVVVAAVAVPSHAGVQVTRDTRRLSFAADFNLGQFEDVTAPPQAGGAFNPIIQREFDAGAFISRGDISATSLRTDTARGFRFAGGSRHMSSVTLVPGGPSSGFAPFAFGEFSATLEFTVSTAFRFEADFETNAFVENNLAATEGSFGLTQLDGGSIAIGRSESGSLVADLGPGRYVLGVSLFSETPLDFVGDSVSVDEFIAFDFAVRVIPAPGVAAPLAAAGVLVSRRRRAR